MKKQITVKMVMAWNPCDRYTEDVVRGLFGKRKYLTVRDVLALDIPVDDRFWVVLREELLSAKIMRLFACDCAERALERERTAGREPDKRSWDAVVVARRYANGKATIAELDAARAAAWAAAKDAEQGWQANHLIAMLTVVDMKDVRR